ncbi:uncharacterized protein J7T54_007555 [Emericellopsis cladophorae]|uniref:Zn(2)-C6 fungal-type domain-containing protein n=1 Tax=Emericellopsis cladophorae TaxID=2686198 RepID=A0A9P9XX95_9HYPO|nr:uncharacterized protein J7T54_007555 [Emericellopsis cladophorae]KAI6779100.1 hypothetical protein J7T54_007555 [Emericellopsis cladophorae]
MSLSARSLRHSPHSELQQNTHGPAHCGGHFQPFRTIALIIDLGSPNCAAMTRPRESSVELDKRHPACTACSKSKRKCSRQLPSCRRCRVQNLSCTYPVTRSSPNLSPTCESVPLATSGDSFSWFLAPASWDIDHVPIGEDDRITYPDSGLEYFLDQLGLWLDQWMNENHCAFIHAHLLALMDESGTNNHVIDKLARVQALLVFQAIGLFEGHVRARGHAESVLSTLTTWADALLESAAAQVAAPAHRSDPRTLLNQPQITQSAPMRQTPRLGERGFYPSRYDLRGGRPCTTDVSKRPKAGSLNWVIFITFDDGIEWVFRSPRRSMSIKKESHYKMTISETSTLKYFGKHRSVPVPEVYSFSGSHDNEIGVPYILMSKASGRALSEYDWSEAFRILGYTIMGQLGGIMSLLSEIHFDKIGSLFEAEDGSSDCSVGECLNPSHLWEKRDTLEGIDRDPFDQESRYLSSLISAFVSHTRELGLSPHNFFASIPNVFKYRDWASYKAAVDSLRWEDFYVLGEGAEGSKNRLSYCLAGEFLREMIPSLASHASPSRGFVPCHPDLHIGNALYPSCSPLRVSAAHHEDGSDDIPRTFHERSMQEHWRELLAKLRVEAEGEGSEEDQSEEEGGGPKMETEKMAVARKLMLMSEMNPNFVADKRLWRWLGDALDKTDSE